MVQTAESLIIPILDAIVNVLFGTSSVGRVIKQALVLLCQTYNMAMQYFFVPCWCAIIRPAIYGLCQALEGLLGVFSSSAANQVSQIWNAISGGDGGLDVQSCLGSLALQIDCSAGNAGDGNSSALTYLPAPIATRCWTDATPSAQMEGAGPFGGQTDAAFLACTGSDTCAQVCYVCIYVYDV